MGKKRAGKELSAMTAAAKLIKQAGKENEKNEKVSENDMSVPGLAKSVFIISRTHYVYTEYVRFAM
ncbi:MAG: hypothetical protein CL798_07350 [Chromatiales bacterium]|nr:hypothetical protein [Chromatiales bacterium]